LQWDDARIFLAIARAGSLSGASAALGLGVATVSRRLDRLGGGRPKGKNLEPSLASMVKPCLY